MSRGRGRVASLAAACALAALAVIGTGSAVAAELPVTSAADNGEGSLRAAVTAAADGDTVKIQPGVNPALSSGEISVAADITISGQSASATTVSAGGNSRIFRIATANVVVEDLTLSGGHAPDGAGGGTGLPGGSGEHGGAVLNPVGSSLTLRRIVVTNSTAGAGANGGGPLLPVLESGAGGHGGHGGAVASGGDLIVRDSAFLGNRAGNGGQPGSGGLSQPAGGTGGDGGALLIIGGPGRSTTLENVTIAGNAAGSGAAGADDGRGGGLFADGGGVADAMTIRHATIANNKASGGAGGGIASRAATGVLTVQNSILAGNSAADGGNCSGNAIVNGGNNIAFGAGGCPDGFSDADPGLAQGPAANGGSTPTIAISARGAAVNAVAGSGEHCADHDQRDVPRPQGSGCDIGAFEIRAPVCEDVAASVRPGRKVDIDLDCIGPGKPTYLTRSEPERGTLSRFRPKQGKITYEAPRRFRGTESFTYAGENVIGQGSEATVTITVEGPFPPSNKIRFGRIDLDRDKGTATLPVTVPGPGQLQASGKGVKNVRRTTKKKGRVKLPIRPSKKARQRLKRNGVATVVAKISFRPRGGFTRTRKREVRLRVNSFSVPI